MKAAVYDVEGAPGVLKYVDVPEPVTGPDDILISVEAISIDDLINRRSTPPPLPYGSWLRGRGHSCCRRIESPKPYGWGQSRCFSHAGSHAERWAVPAERTWTRWGGNRCRFHLEPRIIAFSREACSGREKPFLFRPQRVARGRSACLTSRRNGHRRGKRNAATRSVA
jgi:hypothetical protein